MKKLLTTALSALLLVGCSSSGGTTTDTPTTTDAPTETAQTVSEPETAGVETTFDLTKSSEYTIYDQDGIKVELTGVKNGAWFYFTTTNDSEDKVTIRLEHTIVNEEWAILQGAIVANSIAPGATTDNRFTILDDQIEDMKLEAIGQVDFDFTIYDENRVEISSIPMTFIGPAETYTNTPYSGDGTLVFDQNDIKLYVETKMVDTDSQGNDGFYFYLENNSDYEISVSFNEGTVGGNRMITASYFTMFANSKLIDGYTLTSASYENANGEKVKESDWSALGEVEMSLQLKVNGETYTTDTFKVNY